MKKIGYIKASLKEEVEEQSESLIAVGCYKIYVESKENFTHTHKAKLAQVLEKLHSGDTLVVTRLSILSSNVRSLLDFMFALDAKRVTLQVTKQQFLSSKSYNLDELLFYILEFIEDIRVEKQAYGIQEAKENGKRFGRPPKLSSDKVIKAIELKKYKTSKQVANQFGVGRSTLLRHIARSRKSA